MSLDKPGFLSQLKDRIPQPVQESAAAMRSRFLATSKPVQYTVSGAAGVLVLLVLDVLVLANLLQQVRQRLFGILLQLLY